MYKSSNGSADQLLPFFGQYKAVRQVWIDIAPTRTSLLPKEKIVQIIFALKETGTQKLADLNSTPLGRG